MRFGVGLLAAGFLGFAAWALWPASNQPASSLEPSDGAPPGTHQAPLTQPGAPRSVSKKPSSSTATKTERALEAVAHGDGLNGWVQRQDGSPIPEALVTWTPKTGAIQAALEQGLDPETRWIAKLSTRAVTGADGTFNLRREAANEAGILWITRPGFLAAARSLAAGTRKLDGPVQLEPAPRFTCTVLRSGQPVEGALISHRVVGTSSAITTDQAALFLRQTRSNAPGMLALAPTGLRESLLAQVDGQLSEPWSGEAREGVKLELRPVFFVSGSIVPVADAQAAPKDGRLLLFEEQGLNRVALSNAAPISGSTFDHLAFPIPASGSCIARFEAPGFAPAEARLTAIRAGAQVTVTLEVSPAVEFVVQAWYWESNEIPTVPAKDAAIHCYWRDANDLTVETVAMTDSNGLATFDNLPLSTVTCFPICQDMAGTGVLQFALPWTESEPPAVWLIPSGRIEGTCIFKGKPASDFDVRVWGLPWGDKQARIGVRDSEDGSFVIDNVPYGEIGIVATSPEGYRSGEVNMLLGEAGAEGVELTLQERLPVAGRVLLLPERQPAPGGSVVALMSAGRTLATTAHDQTSLGARFALGPDGSIASPLAVPGANTIEVNVPGYSPLVRTFEAQAGVPVDLGEILLEARGSVEFTIKAPPGESPSDYDIYLYGIESVPFQHIPADGKVRFPSLAASTWSATIHNPTSMVDTTTDFRLNPGAEDSYLIDLAGSVKVTVALTAPGQKDAPNPISIQISGVDAHGAPCHTYTTLFGETEASFGVLGPGNATILACSPDWDYPRAQRSFTIGQEDEQITQTLELSWGRTNCKVVDPSGTPLPGITVTLIDKAIGADSQYVRVTDPEGLCSFVGVTQQFDEIKLQGPAGDFAEGIPFDLRTGKHELNTLVMDTSRSIAVRLMSSGKPVTNAFVTITWPGTSRNPSAIGYPDATGAVRFDGLGEGEYLLAANRPNQNPFKYAISTSLSGQPVDVELPALVTQQIQVVTAEGAPAQGVHLQLELQLPDTPKPKFAVDLSAWAEFGIITSTPAGLTTNASGSLAIEGLPAGHYRWTTDSGSSGVVEFLGAPIKLLLN